MGKHQNIHTLVKSLTKAERRNFTLLSQHHSAGEKTYLFLFQIIAEQNNYDEELIKNRLIEKGIKTRLPVIKKYLKEAIFKSLRYYYNHNNYDKIILNNIDDAVICYEKGLKKMGENFLAKATKLTTSYQKYELMLFILNIEWKYHLIKSDENLINKINQIQEKIALKTAYKAIIIDANNHILKGFVRTEQAKKEWDKIKNNPLISNPPKNLGLNEKTAYNFIKSYTYYNENNIEQAIFYLNDTIQIFEENEFMIHENVNGYVNELNNILRLYCESNKIKEAENVLVKIKTFAEKTNSEFSITRLGWAYANVLKGYINTCSFDRVLAIEESIKQFTENRSHSLLSELLLNMTICYICLENYKQALFWNNQLINLKQDNLFREDIVSDAVLLNLIIHLEINNLKLLPYLFRSSYRVVYRKSRINKGEEVILQFFKKNLVNLKEKGSLIKILVDLKQELLVAFKDPYEAKILQVFDFLAWLDSKIENRPLIEVLKEKKKNTCKV